MDKEQVIKPPNDNTLVGLTGKIKGKEPGCMLKELRISI